MKNNFLLMGSLVSAIAFGDMITEETSVKLKNSIISNILYEHTLDRSIKNIHTITDIEIEEKNFKNVTDALRDSPLVVIREDEMGVIVDMRGSGLNSKATVQILVDGIALNPVDLSHGSISLNIIPISSIEKIEILPGGNSVLYGDGAIGGIINIITKSDIIGKKAFNLGARYGSYNWKQWEVGAASKIRDNFSVQAEYSGADGETHRSREKFKRDNFSITTKYNPTLKDSLKLKYSYGQENKKVANMLTDEELKESYLQSGVDFSGKNSELENNGDILDSFKIIRNEISADYGRKIGSNLNLNLLGAYQRIENNSSKRELNIKNISPYGLVYKKYYADLIGTFTDEKFKFNPTLKYNYMDESYLISGYDFKYQKSSRNFDNFSDMYKEYKLGTEKISNAFYLFNKTRFENIEFTQGYRSEWTDFDMNKKTHYYHRVLPGTVNNGYLDLGLQNDSYHKSMRNDAFELGFNYLYSNTGNIYMNLERNFRTPAPTEFQNKNSTDYQLNNLHSEISHTLEIGIREYFWNSFIGLNFFYTETDGEISYNEILHGNEWYYFNLDKTIRKGMELSAEHNFARVTLSENLSYLHTEIEEKDSSVDGNKIPYAPKLNFNLSAKYSFTDKLNGIVTLNYKGRYFLDRENRYETKKYITLNLAINYRLNSELTLYAGINNLLDRKNYDNIALQKNIEVYNPASPRSYYAGFRYEI